uniref:Gypsy retrotransposon integrase-like protein 1 n=1 Tax=Gouania willdenowi TaxID=441366 RepID=A0A8C5H551_GOUWI
MIDSGSMSCSLSEAAAKRILEHSPNIRTSPANGIVVVGAGGHQVAPTAIYDLEVIIYGFKLLVPTLIIPGQEEDMIVGSNAIKKLLHLLKSSDSYWKCLAAPVDVADDDTFRFLSMLSNTEKWKSGSMPEKIGTVKLKQSVTLEPQCEHLVWGKLPASAPVSAGSTVIVEPTQSRSRPRNVLVGRVISPLWGDRWVPLKLINPSSVNVTLKRNCKIADVSPCVAVEELSPPDKIQVNMQSVTQDSASTRSPKQMVDALKQLGLEDLNLSICEVSNQWKDRLLQLVEKYEVVFSRDRMDCGKASDFVHKIHLLDEKPFRLPYRRVPPSQYEKLRTALNEMEERGIIRKSHSEYASPLVLVWKKDGSLRICTDFRWLNAKTVKDAHPLPHQADALAALGGNVFFSTMDLTSGFYNVPVFEEHKKYTAFSSPFGLHEYNRMPQGLSNSPATFMRMMMSIFGDENFSSLLCYLDDLMVFAPSEQLALQRLEMVFSRLQQHKLKLAPKKCHLLRRTVKFLGHIISEDGVRKDPDKMQVIMDVGEADLMEGDGTTPSWKKIKSFLGMVFYYQHFIADCSAKAKPLFRLLSGQQVKSTNMRGRKPKKRSPTAPALTPSDWTAACRDSFQALKTDLVSGVILAHPNFDEPFILAVDASFDGIGAVLSQVPPGETVARPVAFASKTLSRSQMNYPVHRLEFLALKWAVCDKFSHWLKGRHFTAWTDNNPLSYILTKPRLDACEQRWVAKLAAYDFDLKFVPGAKNIVADALSREPFVKSCVSHRLMKEPYIALLDEVNGVVRGTVQDAFRFTNNCLAVQEGEPGSSSSTAGAGSHPGEGPISSEEVSAVLSAHSDGMLVRLPSASPPLSQLQVEDPSTVVPQSRLLSLQEQDPAISRALFYMQRHKRPTRREAASEPNCTKRLLRHWEKLRVQNGVLYRVTKDSKFNKKVFQFIVPDSLKHQIMVGLHDNAGHQGRARTFSLARERFFWVGMKRDVVNYVRRCERCVVGKTPEPEARAPLENIQTSEPMELVCIDFWTAELGGSKTVDVLVVTDHFSKMAHAFPCRSQSARHVARRLWDDFFCVYGFPKRIHSDQGANFESRLMRDLLEMAGVEKSHTTPYHPMGNGVVERFNRTLGNMLRVLPPTAKAKWPQMLQTLTFSYNCTVHETTGFAPFFLMFGRVPRLPIDIMFQHVLQDDKVVSRNEFVTQLRKDLSEASRIAREQSRQEQARHARLYNRRVKGSPLAVGDRVLQANRGEKGKRKLADKWDSAPYDVVSVRPELNVYRIKNVQTGRERVVHRNFLLPIDFLNSAADEASHVDSDANDVACGSHGDSMVKKGDRFTQTMDWLMQTPDIVISVGKDDENDDLLADVLSDSFSDDDVANTPVWEDGRMMLDQATAVPGCVLQGPEPAIDSDSVSSSPPDPDPSLVVLALDSDQVKTTLPSGLAAGNTTPDLALGPVLVPSVPALDSVRVCPLPSRVDVDEDAVVCAQPQVLGTVRTDAVTTRFGRHVRPPNRLIVEMSTQTVGDVVSVSGPFVSFLKGIFGV